MVRSNAAYAGYVYRTPETNWSSDEAVKEGLKYMDLDAEKKISSGGIPIISDGHKAYIDASDSHTAVYGSSGSGKSLTVFMQLVGVLAKAEENMVVTDPKGELYARMGTYLKQQGYRVRVINYRDFTGEGYNPLHYAHKLYLMGEYDKAALAVGNIVDALERAASKNDGRNIDPFWPDTAKAYMRGAIPAMMSSYKEDAVNFQNLADFNTEKTAAMLKDYLSRHTIDSVEAVNLTMVLAEPERTRMSSLSTCSTFIQPFLQNRKMARMTSHTTFELEELLEEKTALFLIMDDTTEVANTLISILISQLQTLLVDAAFHQPDGRLRTRVNFVLEEFCSFSYIPGMAEALAGHRSRNIRYYLCLQSLDLLRSRYKSWEGMLANCQTTLFLGSTEPELLQRISERVGTTERTDSGHEKPLVTAAGLMTLKKTWESREALYFNLAKGIRYCTTLPAIEAYEVFCKGKAELPVIYHPPVHVYSFADLVSDVTDGKAHMPFAKPEREVRARKRQERLRQFLDGDAPQKEEETLELPDDSFLKELEKKLDEILGGSEENNT